MMNSNDKSPRKPTTNENMDAPSASMSTAGKKTLATSTYYWIGLILILACIPLFNFILVPIVVLAVMAAYGIYGLAKFSKHRREIPPDLRDLKTDESDVDLVMRPGLRSRAEQSSQNQSIDARSRSRALDEYDSLG